MIRRTRSRIFRRWLLLGLLFAAALRLAPADAQDDADPLRRDPAALATRLLGWNGARALPALPIRFDVGDTTTFLIGKAGEEAPTTIHATLAGSAPEIYVWVEQGIAYNPEALQPLALLLDRLSDVLRSRGSYRPASESPVTRGQVIDPANLYPLPDVDGDARLNILFAADLPDEGDAVVNPIDSLPPALQPAGYGNARELIVINTSAYAGADLSSEVFVNMLVRGMFSLIFSSNFDQQAAWLHEALGWYTLFQLQQATVGPQEAAAYLAEPVPMLDPATLTTRAQTLGGHLLFLTYLRQRYGERALLALYEAEGDGMRPLDDTFATLELTDPLTGAPITGDEAFADFVLTNGLNGAFGDGRYVHSIAQLERGQAAATAAIARLPQTLTSTSGPYDAQYFVYEAAQAATIEVTLANSATVARLNLSNSTAPTNRFYWSGRAPNRDHTLTRAFDLTGVSGATLHYDVWHDLPEGWNYGYVEVSSDGGQTWQIMRGTHSTTHNRHGAAYGPGYTGISNANGPRPFPVIGIQIADDGMTIVAAEPSGPGGQAGLRAGDRIIGHDGGPWASAPNVLGLLANYAPGDTLDLRIQRGSEQVDVPVILGASSNRIVQPEPRWLEETVDLSGFAGREILVRFEYISLPGRWSEGFAVDNIAMPEIGYLDDVEGEGDWTLAGWEVVDNQVAARWLLQAATFGAQGQPPRIRRLLGPEAAPEGAWRLPLVAGERLVLVISGMTGESHQHAHFALTIREVAD